MRRISLLPIFQVLMIVLFQNVEGKIQQYVNFTKDAYGEHDLVPWYGFSSQNINPDASLSDRNGPAHMRRAAAVHLKWYQDELTRSDFDRIKKDGWTITNTIRVTKSAQTTYFAVVTALWGYTGINQQEPHHCGKTEGFCGQAVFSMWTDKVNDVTLVAKGENTVTKTFSHEGVGMQSKINNLNWKPGQRIKFTVKGTYVPEIDGWQIETKFRIKKKTYYLATFQRAGSSSKALNDFAFSTFVEDYGGRPCPPCNGCLYKRSAEYFKPTITYKEGGKKKKIIFKKARFTKSNGERVRDCRDWTCGGATGKNFWLETGGEENGPSQWNCPNNMAVEIGSSGRL